MTVDIQLKDMNIPSNVIDCQIMILGLIQQLKVEHVCNHCGEYHGKEVCVSLLNEMRLIEINCDYHADLVEKLRKDISRIHELFKECKPILADSKNTHAVRDGLEQSGYIKYVKMPRTTYVQFKKTLEVE